MPIFAQVATVYLRQLLLHDFACSPRAWPDSLNCWGAIAGRKQAGCSRSGPGIQSPHAEEVAGVVGHDCQFVAQCDSFNQTVFQTQMAVLLLRRGVEAAPLDRGEFVVSQYSVSIVFLEIAEFAGQAAALLALRQKLDALDEFTNCD